MVGVSEEVERIHLFTLLKTFGKSISSNPMKIRKRAEELVKNAFGLADAAHVAFAEAAGAEFSHVIGN
ncbi:hypothetical protein BMS3Abin07_01761 [bacterium BMS3Abin07]|nr:hypothetical protein BMS3Abin07_01761 [bacterium BMS3Abin07]